MNDLEPINQQKLHGLNRYFLELVKLNEANVFPKKILLSGLKGSGKSTLAYHYINYALSKNESFKYDLKNLQIDSESKTFKTILNRSNTNLITIDLVSDKKNIDINQIRELISKLNKSSFNNKPRFVLIDNIELLNLNSINALLKILEEPGQNVYFILINSNKKILPTLTSRCINFRINLTNQECLDISTNILGSKLEDLLNKDFIYHYFTPGNYYQLIKFANQHKYNISDLNLKSFLKLLIKQNHYKKDQFIRYIIFQLIELYFIKKSHFFSININKKYNYFIRRISDTKNFNLDEDSLFTEIEEEILND